MARYVHPDVKEVLESVSGDARVRLAVVPTEGGASVTRERIGQIGGDVDRELPSGVLVVEMSVSELPELIEVEEIDSISPDSRMEILV